MFDWDGTIREGFMLTDWSNYLRIHGLFRESAFGEITRLFEAYAQAKVRYLDLVKRSGRLYQEGLQGAPVEETRQLGEAFVKQDGQVYEFAAALFERLQRWDLKIIVISGAPEVPLISYSVQLGLDHVFGLRLTTEEGGRVWGDRVESNMASTQAKAAKVRELKRQYTVLIGMGNREADMPLLRASSFPLLVSSGNEVTGTRMDTFKTSVPNLIEVNRHNILGVVDDVLESRFGRN